MKQTTAPQSTPSPARNKTNAVANGNQNPTSVFFSMVMDMSWRLAIVVLVPIIGGVELDKHYHHSYRFLVIGLILAASTSILVVYRSYKLANSLTGGKAGKK